MSVVVGTLALSAPAVAGPPSDDACPSPIPLAGAAVGTVGGDDWRDVYKDTSAGGRTYVAKALGGRTYVLVWDSTCTTVLCHSWPGASCSVTTSATVFVDVRGASVWIGDPEGGFEAPAVGYVLTRSPLAG